MQLSSSCVFDSSIPFLEWLCIGALTRQVEIGTLIAVWPHGGRRLWNIFLYDLRQRPLQSFRQRVWFYSSYFFSPRLSSLPEVFLGSSSVPDDCLAVRMHTCFWCFASFPPVAPASAVHTSSESNSSVYRLNSWLHSSGLRVSARRFWWNPFKLIGCICLQCVHLGMKCSKEAVGCTLCWGLHAVCVVLKVFCGYRSI